MGIGGNRGGVVVLTAGALACWAACTPAAAESAVTRSAAPPPAVTLACSHIATTGPAPASLFGVTGVSASDAWAVGRTSGYPGRPVLAHWDGSSCGFIGNRVPVILHWNGTAWRSVPLT